MPANNHIRLDDIARGVNLTIHDGAAPSIDISFRSARDNVHLNATVTFDPAPPGMAENVALLCDAAQNPAAPDEQRGRASRLTQRAEIGMRRATRAIRDVAEWLLLSRENTNHTYDLTPLNLMQLAHGLALVVDRPVADLKTYLSEPGTDGGLARHITEVLGGQDAATRAVADSAPRFGRRLGWYAVVRALKPRLVVETGVDKGLGAVLLCAALQRNGAEGSPGRYLGTDIRPEAGYLLSGPYAKVGQVAYGDSLATLGAIAETVDLFINDSDHNPAYEEQEYRTILPRLHRGSVIISDNSHSTDVLAKFAEETGRRFVFLREQPKDHWYPGAGIGLAFT